MMRFLIFFLFIIAFPPVCGAETANPDVAALLLQARDQKIAHHPYWLALLHYQKTNFGAGVTSEISNPDFFLSAQGAVDSDSELAATLTAFFQPPSAAPDDHAQCRYVARYQWLRKMLDWHDVQPPQVICRQFNDWSRQGHMTSISLLFATGYFSNPASFYGHILLKFNTERRLIQTDLLDESLNFGAIVPDNENPLRYVVKGMFGEYDAAFSSTGFYRLNHTYAEEELRDMWAYELALSPDELAQISAHSWELLRSKFDYYFFNENCAYRMAELLALVVHEPLLTPSVPWSVPSAVFDHLATITRDSKPLVRDIKRIPSRLNRYREQYHRLTQQQQNIVQDYVAHKSSLAQTSYASLTSSEQIALVDTLRDYYQFRIVGDRENTALRTRKRDLLLARAELPAISATQLAQAAQNQAEVPPPHLSPPPGLVRLGVSHNNQFGAGETLQFRPVYFDNLELNTGRIANANLTMFDVSASHTGNRWQIRNVDLVNIEHLNVADTPLPADGGWAWRVKFGALSENLACNNCLVANITGGIGKAVKLGDAAVVYAMLDGLAQTRYAASGTLATQPRLGLLVTPLEGWKTNVVLSRRTYLNGNQARTPQVSWENRLGVARDWDVRLNYHYSVASEWQMALSTYW